MDTWTVALLHCFLFAVVVQSAPAGSPSDPQLPFREATERAKTLVEKILKDVPSVHTATVNAEGLSLDSSSLDADLQMMVVSLGIPAPPVLKPLSALFTPDMCVSRMLAGSRMYQGLLGVLSDKLSGLNDLKADLRDLVTHINKMKEAAQFGEGDGLNPTHSPDLASRLHGNYEQQVAVHATLRQLRSFCHDMIRSLRAVAAHRPRAAATR